MPCQHLLRRPLQPQLRETGGRWRQRIWRRLGGHQTHHLPDSWPRCRRGQGIYIGQGGIGQKEAPTNHGRQGSPEGIPKGQESEEALEVLARDSGPLQDLPVPKEY